LERGMELMSPVGDTNVDVAYVYPEVGAMMNN
jgi:hypothetical protein